MAAWRICSRRARPSYFERLLELCRENERSPGLVRLFTVRAAEAVEGDHPGHSHFRERYSELRRTVAAQLAAEQREGRIDADLDVELVAPQILAMFEGLQLQWPLDPGEVDMVGVFRDFLACLRA